MTDLKDIVAPKTPRIIFERLKAHGYLHGMPWEAFEHNIMDNGGMNTPQCLVGMPSGTRRIDFGCSDAFWVPARPGCGLRVVGHVWAISGCTHNTIVATAMKARKYGLAKLAILHDDMQPLVDWWLEKLHEAQEATGADFVCGFPMVKDERGLSSIGLHYPEDHPEIGRKLHGREAKDLPDYFTAEDVAPGRGAWLWINLGCCLFSVKPDWFMKLQAAGFSEIRHNENGPYVYFCGEDWLISQQLHEFGAKVVAVHPRKLPLGHWGDWRFDNNDDWGADGTDIAYLQAKARDFSEPTNGVPCLLS